MDNLYGRVITVGYNTDFAIFLQLKSTFSAGKMLGLFLRLMGGVEFACCTWGLSLGFMMRRSVERPLLLSARQLFMQRW
jgi:hypothetical protein